MAVPNQAQDAISFGGAEVSGGTVVNAVAQAPGTTNFAFSNLHSSGLIVVIDITAVTGTTAIVVTIEGVAGAKHWTILASASLVGAQTVVLRVSPQITASANLIAQDIVPPNLNIKVVDSGSGDTATYAISAFLTD